MKTSAEFLEQANKYDALAAQATTERRRVGYANLAGVYRILAEEAALLEGADPSAAHKAVRERERKPGSTRRGSKGE